MLLNRFGAAAVVALALGACGGDPGTSAGRQLLADAGPPGVVGLDAAVLPSFDAPIIEPAPEGEPVDEPDAGTPAAPCEGARCPSAVRPAHLQLWLRADVGVACSVGADAGIGGRARRWPDLSGHERHARPARGHRGPGCTDGGAAWNGRQVMSFGNDVDADLEQLEVELGFLVGRPFTIVVVERRRTQGYLNFFVGSKLPIGAAAACESANPNAGLALTFGWETPHWLRGSTWGATCDAHLVAGTDQERPGIDWLIHGPERGLAVRASSVPTSAEAPDAPPLAAIGTGLIGRGWLRDGLAGDSRFRGDVAELIVWDDVLDDGDRAELEAYFHETWGAM